MNGIDDEFIEEALTYERSKKRKPSCVLRIVLVAALISVLLFTSALAFSPSLRENTLNVLVEIFSDHATFCVEGDEPAGSYIAGKIDYSARKRPIVLIRKAATGSILPVALHFSATTVRSFQSPSWPLETA